MVETRPSIKSIRAQFPSLEGGFAFLENAGGSQVPAAVIDATVRYMRESYVQLGAGYGASDAATEIVQSAHDFGDQLVGGHGNGMCVLGPSTTQLLSMLAQSFGRSLSPGRIIVAENGHEANIGPWFGLEALGWKVDVWACDLQTGTCHVEELERMLKTERANFVAFPHVSNLLGEVQPVAEIARIAHQYGAKVVVDGVAYAPHRPLQVDAWDVDWYVLSTYKVYGPHMAILWGRSNQMLSLKGPNHFFVPEGIPYKFELGGPCHEGCVALLGTRNYLQSLGEHPFQTMSDLEIPLQEALVTYLMGKNLQIVGPRSFGLERVPTISFRHPSLSSAEIARRVNSTGAFGIRHGHMYAYRLCERMGIPVEDGVVRVSMVHYNTLDEIERLCNLLEEIL